MRILLFLATNLAVLVTAAVAMTVLTALGVIPQNAPYVQLLVWCALFGFGGSFISLAMSKWIAKRSTGARVIAAPAGDLGWLLDAVRRQAAAAGVGMPEVAVFPSPDANAFATGMSRNNALVAVSTGLLQSMSRDQIEAVLGHEMTHVANGDMVTLTLIQGVLNTFVLFASRVVASQFRRGRFLIYLVLQMVFGMLASIVLAWFSRRREFRADAGGARLEGVPSMVSALDRLRALSGTPAQLPGGLAAFGIHGGGLGRLMSTHPPLEERIARLKALRT